MGRLQRWPAEVIEEELQRQGQAPYWEPMALATRLYLGCQRALQEAEGLAMAKEFARSCSSDERWRRLDLGALELAARSSALTPEERQRFARPAPRAYARCLDEANRKFARAVKAAGWVPAQAGLWKEPVRSGEWRAISLVGALHLDLGHRLAGRGLRVGLRATRAVLPTTTEPAVAALLPRAQEGLEVAVNGEGSRAMSGQITMV
ncbi:MAG: hypothetical protein HPY83_17565 [Anaerolineae bacterium]|nr:hypothetical protein [Anaerolineae bacterium]